MYPAILTDSLHVAQQQLDLVIESGLFETVQVDFIDGYFTDSITLTPADLVELAWGDLNVDVHLITVDPLDYVNELVEFKKQLPIRAVITQVEKLSAPEAFITEVQRHEWQAGFSLDLFTTLEAIEEELLPKLDILQVMGNQAGVQGLSLHPRAIATLRQVSQAAKQNSYAWEILCDIGVKRDTLDAILQAGATGVAVGSALWNAPDFSVAAEELLGIESN